MKTKPQSPPNTDSPFSQLALSLAASCEGMGESEGSLSFPQQPPQLREVTCSFSVAGELKDEGQNSAVQAVLTTSDLGIPQQSHRRNIIINGPMFVVPS